MTKELLKHNGYTGTVECALEDGVLHGKVLFVADLITYEAESVAGLKSAFEAAVDDYLETCAEMGKEPDHPASGAFNIRTGEERHQALVLRSLREGTSINALVNQAIDMLLGGAPVENNHNHHHEHELKVVMQGSAINASTAGVGSGLQMFEARSSYDNAIISRH